MSSAASWAGVWNRMGSIEFGREPYMWRFYERLLGGFDFRGKTVLEMGCGTGINTILMAKRGARVTFLDYSKEALEIVRRNMEQAGVDGELILGDILSCELGARFDIVHSEGVIEHFRGRERQLVLDRHAEAARSGGQVLIIVPHMASGMYRVGKFISEKAGVWIHGSEYPYTARELDYRMRKAGLEPGRIVGGEMLFAAGWMFSFLWLRNGSVLERSITSPAREAAFRINYDNPIADRWGRVIACVGRKPTSG